ncbi:MAG: VWA domain-containing protein [Acidobacteriota bacterium]
MKIIAFAVAIICFCLSDLAAQAPTPRPVTNDGDVVKISTDLIQIDVTVTDPSGRAVINLKPEEIEIFENGKKQKITNFSFVSPVKEPAERSGSAVAPRKVDVPLPTVALRPENIRRTIALVVDDLELSWESVIAIRRALKKFVDEQMQSGDLVTITRTGSGVGALQQFTSDKRVLYAAIERIKWNPLGYAGTSPFASIEPTLLQQRMALGDASLTEQDIQEERRKIAEADDERSGVFANGTLTALAYLIGGMGELPGRKSVVLFSEGFRLRQRDNHGLESGGRIAESLKHLVDLANRSSVVFYTVDARGPQATAFSSKDLLVLASSDELNEQLGTRTEQLRSTQEGLAYLASETGGISIRNTNDLSAGVGRVLEDQSYYLVGYLPDEETFDPATRRFNQLDVKVSRPGTKVRYRSGFFNVVNEANNTVATAKTPAQQLKAALTSPFSISGLTLRLNALFGNDPVAGSYVRSLLHIDASDLTFTDEKDGAKKIVLDILAVSFGDSGQPIDQIAKTYTLTVKPDVYEKLLVDGLVCDLAFPVKNPGSFQYRMVIRDTASGKLGSASQFVEVPNLKKGQLTMSGIALVSFSPDQWNRLASVRSGGEGKTPIADTALRRIKSGSVLQYGYEIYNAKLDSAKQPNLSAKIRVFRDGKVFLDGHQLRVEFAGQKDPQRIRASGAIEMGKSMPPGDYILQIVVTDENNKQSTSTQYMQFEVVDQL